MVSIGVWVTVGIIAILVIYPTIWITNKAYSKKWEEDEVSAIDTFIAGGTEGSNTPQTEQEREEASGQQPTANAETVRGRDV
ncbi:hypothetical protein [Paenibacillus turpanensis]|uniref:hypothetical protein n=1 Tax=Paenibacillus turpanensis TaxID=2689078 RepID=UPI00140B7A8E|nr:hypothetical protein [Paenibacillus turpanensis]